MSWRLFQVPLPFVHCGDPTKDIQVLRVSFAGRGEVLQYARVAQIATIVVVGIAACQARASTRCALLLAKPLHVHLFEQDLHQAPGVS